MKIFRPLQLVFYFVAVILSTSCSREKINWPLLPTDVVSPDVSTETSIVEVKIEQTGPLVLWSGQQAALSLGIIFSDGTTQSAVTEWRDDSGEEITWHSSSESVVGVSDSGILTALSEGVASVSAKMLNQSTQIDVIVQSSPVNLESLRWSQSNLIKTTRESELLTLDASFSDGSIYQDISTDEFKSLNPGCDPKLKSDNEVVAVLLQTGELTAVGEGNSILTVSCGDLSHSIILSVPSLPKNSTEPEEVLQKIEIILDASEEEVGETISLQANLTFNSGTVLGVSNTFVTPSGRTATLSWKADASMASIEEGQITFLQYGSVRLEAMLEDIMSFADLEIKLSAEEALKSSDYFLGADDDFTFEYGVNGGFGSDWAPEILYGSAWTGGTDVVSLGGGGSLLIKLSGYLLVDGIGADFTLFENPQYLTGYKLFAERAEVSVSEDGKFFHTFPCQWQDTENQVYQGCAGVAMVNALSNPFDTTVSGGDVFDLADVGLSKARYILIQDMDTCVDQDPTYPLCSKASTQGFDLDAMVILNGVNEK